MGGMLASGSRRRENQTHERSAGLQIPQGKPAPGHERRHLSEPIWTGSGRKRNLAAAARGDTERSRISPTSRPAPQPQPGPCPPTAQMKAAPRIPLFLLLGGREETLLLGNNLRRSGALLWGKTGAGPKDRQTDTARTPRCCRGRPWMAPALRCLGRKVSEPLRPAASMQAFGSAVAVGSIKANCFLFQTIKKSTTTEGSRLGEEAIHSPAPSPACSWSWSCSAGVHEGSGSLLAAHPGSRPCARPPVWLLRAATCAGCPAATPERAGQVQALQSSVAGQEQGAWSLFLPSVTALPSQQKPLNLLPFLFIYFLRSRYSKPSPNSEHGTNRNSQNPVG